MAKRPRGPKQKGLFATAERIGINRGVFGGSKGWFYVGSGLWTLRTVRKMAQRKTEVLVSEELKPGQRLIIANGRVTVDDGPAPVKLIDHRKPSRRARRKARA